MILKQFWKQIVINSSDRPDQTYQLKTWSRSLHKNFNDLNYGTE